MSESLVLRPGEYTTEHYSLLTVESLNKCAFAPCRAFWLLTTGRSGTEWLTSVLNGLEPFRAVHEPFPTLFKVARDVVDEQIPAAAVPYAVLTARMTLVEQGYQRGLTVVDTSPRMTPLAPAIRKVFSAARFIHLSREPRAFVRSALARQWFKMPHPQEWWWPHSVPYEEDWQRLVWFWNETHAQALKLEQDWGPDRVFRARAEDLWFRPGALKPLLEWLGCPERLIEATEPEVEAARTKKKNVGHAHAEWSPEWESFLLEIAGDTMRELGYA